MTIPNEKRPILIELTLPAAAGLMGNVDDQSGH